ncbi:MAG: lysophospholipid acyltransferase family protein [Endomicrobia bacterium]|nr:lysophospholipid acyltransferase family protein [Endomicrobiia bacterium]MDW8056160.1 lysophospholipid acyltransferase family protein [Elusimicrobiota bacterium]
MKIREWVEYVIVFKIVIAIILLPEFFLKQLLHILIPAVKFFLYFRQEMMIRNFVTCFPKTNYRDVVKIINDVWFNIGWTFITSIKYIFDSRKVRLKVRLDNLEIKDLSGNTIIVTAHIGNWELLAQRLVLEGYKIAAIVRPLRNKLIDAKVKQFREKLGGKVFYAHQLKKVIDWLKSGGIIYVLPDQHIIEGSVRVEFLGRPAYTSPVVRLLNKRLNSNIITMFCIREKSYYKVFMEKYTPKSLSDIKSDLEYNTLQINKIIEKYIRMYPSQWMWLHRRWKEN